MVCVRESLLRLRKHRQRLWHRTYITPSGSLFINSDRCGAGRQNADQEKLLDFSVCCCYLSKSRRTLQPDYRMGKHSRLKSCSVFPSIVSVSLQSQQLLGWLTHYKFSLSVFWYGGQLIRSDYISQTFHNFAAHAVCTASCWSSVRPRRSTTDSADGAQRSLSTLRGSWLDRSEGGEKSPSLANWSNVLAKRIRRGLSSWVSRLSQSYHGDDP